MKFRLSRDRICDVLPFKINNENDLSRIVFICTKFDNFVISSVCQNITQQLSARTAFNLFLTFLDEIDKSIYWNFSYIF